MSTAFFIVLDRQDVGFSTIVNGQALSQYAAQLRKIAISLGLQPLEQYVSYPPEHARATMEALGTDPGTIERISLPAQTWPDPRAGLEWTSRVSAHIRANPSSVRNPEGVLLIWAL